MKLVFDVKEVTKHRVVEKAVGDVWYAQDLDSSEFGQWDRFSRYTARKGFIEELCLTKRQTYSSDAPPNWEMEFAVLRPGEMGESPEWRLGEGQYACTAEEFADMWAEFRKAVEGVEVGDA